MESPDFPRIVKECLDEHFKGKFSHQPYEVYIGDILEESLEEEELKWSVQSWGFSCCAVEEDVKGRIWILSDAIESTDGWVEEYHMDPSQLKSLLKDLQDKKNWKKYKKYKGLITRLRFEEEIAKLVTRKTGVEVALFIPSNLYFKYCRFYSVFDASNMTNDQKIEEIKRRADAIVIAYKSWEEGKRRLYRKRMH